MKYYLWILSLLFSCKVEDLKDDRKKNDDSNRISNVYINPKPSIVEKQVIHPTLQDTVRQIVTSQGWAITLNQKNNDLHVRWKKEHWEHVHVFKDVLAMRSSFIPQYIAESDSMLYFESACASGCKRISVVSKYSAQVKELDYVFMVDYEKERFLNITTFDPIAINQVDYKRRMSKKYLLTGSCLVAYLPSCIENIKYAQNLTELSINSKLKGVSKTEKLKIAW